MQKTEWESHDTAALYGYIVFLVYVQITMTALAVIKTVCSCI